MREPDYEPHLMRQPTAVTRVIERTGGLVLDLWRQRHRIRDERRSVGEFEDRNRRIFYDTDMIHEVQRERLRLCRDCGGAFRIDSTSDRGRHVLAIHIPLGACRPCREQGDQ